MTRSAPPPALTDDHALFLDFDGTLAPIRDDPDAVALPSGGAQVLGALARRLGGALALLSGRDVRDLSRRVPGSIWRAGGHGLEICAPGEAPACERAAAPEILSRAIAEAIEGIEGARIETKGEILAVHYRAAPDAAGILSQRLAIAAARAEGYSLQHGKMVFEAKPAHAHKGAALLRLMRHAPFAGRVPVMVGDDTTDEDAMQAALDAGGLAVKVGQGESLAPARLSTPDDVWNWLGEAV